MNITENYPKCALSGRKEIHPCVLQDIGPLGPLPKKRKKKKKMMMMMKTKLHIKIVRLD